MCRITSEPTVIETTATPLTPRRRLILDAAQDVVIEQGLRGLTHRAVDREADLPQGSTSGYFRTRQALQWALATYVMDQLSVEVDVLAEGLAGCELGDGRGPLLIAETFARWLEERRLVAARLELTLEAARDEPLRQLLSTGRDRVVTIVGEVLADHHKDHSRDRADAIVASLDGILLGALLKPEAERAEFLDRSLQLTLAPLENSQ